MKHGVLPHTVLQCIEGKWNGVLTSDFTNENKESETNALLNRAHELSEADRKRLYQFQSRFENFKQLLESRIRIGNAFQQVS
uniref:Uncharacterized protein n=1 Tax=Parascaris equorum TaxID=6256 RepID=A0A914S5T0_PAREQ